MKKILLIFIIIFALTGCFNYTELNQMGIVSSIGIDKKDGKYIVSAQVMNAKENDESQDSQITVYEQKGDSVLAALREITLKSPRKLFGGHLSKIVLSEEVAKEGIINIMDTFQRLTEVRNEFAITVVKNQKASDVLKVLTTTETVPAEYAKLTLDSADNYSGLTYSTKSDEFVALYLKKFIDPSIPVIKIENFKKKGTTMDNVTTSNPISKIEIDSKMAITKNGKLKGYLNKNETIGYNFIRNQIQQMIIPVKCDNKNFASITINNNKTKNKVQKKKNEYIITLNMNSNGMITEYNCDDNINDEKNIIKIEKKTEKQIKKYVKMAIKKQNKEKSQFLGLKRIIYLDYPKYKNEKYNIKIKVNVDLPRKGQIRNAIKGEKKDE